MRGDAEAEELVVGSDLDVANLSFLKISAFFAIVHSLEISFVMIVDKHLFAINNDNKCVVIFNGVEAFNFSHWEILSSLAWVADCLAAFTVL